MSSREAFEKWAKAQFSLGKRADGGYVSDYTEFAWEAWQAATERAGKTRARKPRALSVYGTGALYGEQQYCFECGWREGRLLYAKPSATATADPGTMSAIPAKGSARN